MENSTSPQQHNSDITWYTHPEHVRTIVRKHLLPFHFKYKGGMATVACFALGGKAHLDYGVALCSPQDKFCPNKGAELAMDRLLGDESHKFGGRVTNPVWVGRPDAVRAKLILEHVLKVNSTHEGSNSWYSKEIKNG